MSEKQSGPHPRRSATPPLPNRERGLGGEGFKPTELGDLPAEWNVVRLTEAVNFSKKPRNLNLTNYDVIPFIPMELVPDNGTFIKDYEPKTRVSSGTYCEKGDILLAKITPSFENGKQGIVGGLPLDFAYATTEVYPLKAKLDKLDQMFLFHFLKLPYVRVDIAGKMEGTTGRQRIPKSVVENYPIPLPPLDEQRRIAHVLNTVQQAIAAQDDLIAAAQEVKRSLMRRLFTYGPGPEPAPTKETEIGEVPEHWEVVQLGEIAEIQSGGTPSRKKSEYWNGDIPWVKTGEIAYKPIMSAEEKITELGLKNSSARLFPKGTLLMAMYGQGVTRGRVAILGIDATINQACAAITPNGDVMTDFLYHLFVFRYEAIRNLGHGANQKNLSGRLVKIIPCPLPPLPEQHQIAHILQAADAKIAAEQDRRAALRELFNSLLQALMTGRRRV